MEDSDKQIFISQSTNKLVKIIGDDLKDELVSNQKFNTRLKNKCKLHVQNKKIKPNSLNNFTASLLLFPSSFFYGIFSTIISVMYEKLAQELKVDTNIIKLLVHGQNTVCLMVMIVANRFIQKYGLYQMHCFGGWLILISSLIVAIIPNIYVLYAGSIISSIGYSFSLPTYVPLSKKLSKKNPQLTIAINNAIGSASSLLVITLKPVGNLVQFSTWRIVYTIGGILMISYCICCQVFLPFEAAQKTLKLNFCGIILAMMANLVLGVGVILTQNLINFSFSTELGFVFVAISSVLFWSFLVHNKKAAFPVIPRPVLNKNTVLFVIQILFQSLSVQIDSVSEGTTWEKIFDMDENKQSFFMHVCKLTPIIAIPLIHFSIKFVTCRTLLCSTCAALMTLQLMKALSVTFWAQNYYSLLIINLFIATLYIQALTTTQYYNVSSSPPRYGPTSTSYITYFGKLAYAVSFVIQRPVKFIKDPIRQLTVYQTIAVVAASIGMQIARKIGLFKFDRGKLGYKEQKLLHCVTYPEMYDEFKNRYKTMKRKNGYNNLKYNDSQDQIRVYKLEIDSIKQARR